MASNINVGGDGCGRCNCPLVVREKTISRILWPPLLIVDVVIAVNSLLIETVGKNITCKNEGKYIYLLLYY